MQQLALPARTLAQEIVDGACARSELLLCHRLRRLAGETAEIGHGAKSYDDPFGLHDG
jgi:hypothetical protein